MPEQIGCPIFIVSEDGHDFLVSEQDSGLYIIAEHGAANTFELLSSPIAQTIELTSKSAAGSLIELVSLVEPCEDAV